MGLAISIVGSVPEKVLFFFFSSQVLNHSHQLQQVWFHTCQSKGKKCSNTKLVGEEGGCAIWYNEPEFWKVTKFEKEFLLFFCLVCSFVVENYTQNIQERLGMDVPHLNQEFKLANADSTVYGEKKIDSETMFLKGHAEQLKPLVQELAELEDNAQKSFWLLKDRWTKPETMQEKKRKTK
jgi:ATP-dependent RNA helicase DDX1